MLLAKPIDLVRYRIVYLNRCAGTADSTLGSQSTTRNVKLLSINHLFR